MEKDPALQDLQRATRDKALDMLKKTYVSQELSADDVCLVVASISDSNSYQVCVIATHSALGCLVFIILSLPCWGDTGKYIENTQML